MRGSGARSRPGSNRCARTRDRVAHHRTKPDLPSDHTLSYSEDDIEELRSSVEDARLVVERNEAHAKKFFAAQEVQLQSAKDALGAEKKSAAKKKTKKQVQAEEKMALMQQKMATRIQARFRGHVQRQKPPGSGTTLNLAENGIADGGGQSIADIIRGTSGVASLDLSNNRLEHRGLTAIASALQYNDSVTEINLSGNPLGRAPEAVASLAHSLSQNKSLRKLSLAKCQVAGRTGPMLAGIFKSASLEDVNLAWNELRALGGMAMVRSLKGNPCKQVRCVATLPEATTHCSIRPVSAYFSQTNALPSFGGST